MSGPLSGRKRLALLPACLLFLSLASAASTRAATPPVTLCVHPYLPASEIQERFTPLVSYLSRALGMPVQLRIAKDYRNHISRFRKEKKGFCFLGPASYVKLVDLLGKQRILGRLESAGKPYFKGLVFVAERSPVRTLSELAGKRFAFGDPESTMSTLVPRHLLSRSGVSVEMLSRHSFLGNHDNIVLGVLMGDFDAGAVMESVFAEHKHRGLRAIAESPEISEHVFIAGSEVSPALLEKAKRVLLNMKNSEEGREALRAIKSSVSGIVPACDGDYDSLREIMNEVRKTGGGP